MPEQSGWSCDVTPEDAQWDALLEEALQRGKAVPEITWFKPGEDAAWHVRACPPSSAGLLEPRRCLRPAVALGRSAASVVRSRRIDRNLEHVRGGCDEATELLLHRACELSVRGNRWLSPDHQSGVKSGHSFGLASSHMHDGQWSSRLQTRFRRRWQTQRRGSCPRLGWAGTSRCGTNPARARCPTCRRTSTSGSWPPSAPPWKLPSTAAPRRCVVAGRGRLQSPRGRRCHCHKTGKARTWIHIAASREPTWMLRFTAGAYSRSHAVCLSKGRSWRDRVPLCVFASLAPAKSMQQKSWGRSPGVRGRIPRGDDSAEGAERQLLLLRAQLRHPGLRRPLGAGVPGQAPLRCTRVHIHPVRLQPPICIQAPRVPRWRSTGFGPPGIRRAVHLPLAARHSSLLMIIQWAMPMWPLSSNL